MDPKQGDIYIVSLAPTIGTEISKTRPCVVVSNNAANRGSHRVSVVPITSSIDKVYSFEVLLVKSTGNGLEVDSKAACDQVRSIDKQRLLKHVGIISIELQDKIKEALRIHFSL